MDKLRHLRRKYPIPTLVIAFLVPLILGAAAVVYVVLTPRLPNTVWLPDRAKYAPKSDADILYNLPVKSDRVDTKYGDAVRFSLDDSNRWQTIYQLIPNGSLKAYECPNIAKFESLSPSDCEKIGAFQGQPVYAMNRSLPSGSTEYFVELEDVFIFVKSGGDGGRSLNYLNTFVSMPRGQVGSYLKVNKQLVEKIKAKQQAEKEATDKINALAYTKLDFTPALPKSLPAGWRANDKIDNPVQIDGPDAKHPSMVNVDYTDSAHKQFVTVHSARLSNFTLGLQCGPSPGYGMEKLACRKVDGKDYYEAMYGDDQYWVRYLYYPVGDSLVISHIAAYADGEKPPLLSAELMAVQNAITLSVRPIDKSTLKGSVYYKLYY